GPIRIGTSSAPRMRERPQRIYPTLESLSAARHIRPAQLTTSEVDRPRAPGSTLSQGAISYVGREVRAAISGADQLTSEWVFTAGRSNSGNSVDMPGGPPRRALRRKRVEVARRERLRSPTEPRQKLPGSTA